jgi:hypothetical protein
MSADPIAMHVSALEHALRGPRRIRRDMISEVRAGLWDAATAYREGGLPAEAAAMRAVRDFGTVGEVAPEFQDELTARQGRWSALLLALVFPGMMLAWDLFWSFGWTRGTAGPASPVVRVLPTVEDTVTLVVAATALALLALTFRRSVAVHRVTRAIGLTGVAGAVLCGGLALAMNITGNHKTAVHMVTHPAGIVPYVGSAAVMTLVIWQSLRTLRVARACFRRVPSTGLSCEEGRRDHVSVRRKGSGQGQPLSCVDLRRW